MVRFLGSAYSCHSPSALFAQAIKPLQERDPTVPVLLTAGRAIKNVFRSMKVIIWYWNEVKHLQHAMNPLQDPTPIEPLLFSHAPLSILSDGFR